MSMMLRADTELQLKHNRSVPFRSHTNMLSGPPLAVQLMVTLSPWSAVLLAADTSTLPLGDTGKGGGSHILCFHTVLYKHSPTTIPLAT